jgi:hypothetical protein
MRLLHTDYFTFHEFFDNDIPPYAILSHRWSDEEVSFQEFNLQRSKFLRGETTSYGWSKIRQACELAQGRGPRPLRSDNLEWVWIDTCPFSLEQTTVVLKADIL